MILLLSYGNKHGKAPKADIVWSAMSLPNPHSVARLRVLTGQHQDVQNWLRRVPNTRLMVDDIVQEVLRYVKADPRESVIVAVGCYGGKHRSVAVVEMVASVLRGSYLLQPIVGHRDIGRE